MQQLPQWPRRILHCRLPFCRSLVTQATKGITVVIIALLSAMITE